MGAKLVAIMALVAVALVAPNFGGAEPAIRSPEDPLYRPAVGSPYEPSNTAGEDSPDDPAVRPAVRPEVEVEMLVARVVADTVACAIDDGFDLGGVILINNEDSAGWSSLFVPPECNSDGECEYSGQAAWKTITQAHSKTGKKLELPAEVLAMETPQAGTCDGSVGAARYPLREASTETLALFDKRLEALRQGQYYEELFAGLTCVTRVGPGDKALVDKDNVDKAKAKKLAKVAHPETGGRVVLAMGMARLTLGDIASDRAVQMSLNHAFYGPGAIKAETPTIIGHEPADDVNVSVADEESSQMMSADKSGRGPLTAADVKKLLNALRIIDPGCAGMILSERMSEQSEEAFVDLLAGLRLRILTALGVRERAEVLQVPPGRIPELEDTAVHKATALYNQRRSECIVCATKSVPVYVNLGLNHAMPLR